MWEIVIDVSGMPPKDIYIGLVLFNDKYKPLFLKEFYEVFPHLKGYEKKATRVNKDLLLKTLRFFNDKRLRMVCYHFKEHQWKKHESRINDLIQEVNPNHTYRDNFYRFYEKIMGILYYYSIVQIGIKTDSYNVVACHESSLDIWQIFRTIQTLAKRDGWNIQPTANIRSVEHLLKMADYVAGAGRKIEPFKLEPIPRHIILNDPIKDFDLKKVFRIWDRQLNLERFIKN